MEYPLLHTTPLLNPTPLLRRGWGGSPPSEEPGEVLITTDSLCQMQSSAPRLLG